MFVFEHFNFRNATRSYIKHIIDRSLPIHTLTPHEYMYDNDVHDNKKNHKVIVGGGGDGRVLKMI